MYLNSRGVPESKSESEDSEMPHQYLNHLEQGERDARYPPRLPVRAVYTPSSVPTAGSPVKFTELTAPLARRKLVVITSAILGLLLGLAVSFFTSPTYRARTSIQLEGFSDDNLLREIVATSALGSSESTDSYLANEVKILESETLARRVAKRLDIQPTEQDALMAQIREQVHSFIPSAAQPAPKTLDQRRMELVQKALTVKTSLRSQVIELFYDAPTPELAAEGANAAASEYREMNREARQQLVRDSTEWLRGQTAGLKADLENSNRKLDEFARSAGLVFAGKQNTLAEDQMRQLQESLARAEADRAAKQSRYEAAVANPASLMADSIATSPLHKYQTDLQSMRQELAQLRTLYTPTNYKVQSLEAKIAESEAAIQTEINQTVARLRTEAQAAAGLERMLKESRDRQRETVMQQTDQERHYNDMQSATDTTRHLHDSLLQKLKEAGAASALRTTNVRIIDPATPPTDRYSPNTALNIAIGLLIGVVGGVGAAFMSGQSNKIRQPGETVHFDLPELGVIPSASHRWTLGPPGNGLLNLTSPHGGLGLITWHRDTSMMSESFRSTLTSILLQQDVCHPALSREAHSRGQALGVTSLDAMEGKTTLLTNLGVAAAERNLRVLLIDADLRRPRLHEIFRIGNEHGLTDLLQRSDCESFVEASPLAGLARATHITNLWVLPSGPTDSTAAKLLYSANIGALLRRLRRDFHLVLIDTAPLNLYGDARILGRISDGLVMVVRSNTKTTEELKVAYQKLSQDEIPVLGMVLNDWKMDSSRARTYGRYYDRYHNQTDTFV
jgi:polysaccharide biosynthesis transport protein